VLTATFYGVRGSTPCSCDSTRAFGGNTSCVLVDVDDDAPIVLDLGTGARYAGHDLLARRAYGNGSVNGSGAGPDEPFRGTALVSHLHWDHIQGAPFFKPLLTAGAELLLVGPRQQGSSLETELTQFVRPPAFPVSLAQLPGRVRFHDAANETLQLGSARITVFDVPHIGPTNGYRIDGGGGSIAYVSDHQQPVDGSHHLPDGVVEACRGVDILIHDAQYDAAEFALRSDWGHCTPDFALELARRAGARRLVLFHHDPSHDDDWVCATVARIQAGAGPELEVIGAFERLRLTSGSAAARGARGRPAAAETRSDHRRRSL
jgi:phosphoribosyl 1,2-cyclic phosphodiesterase